MITKLFVEFIVFSVVGWLWESFYCTIKDKKWSNRGFLFGPMCPIYGTGVVLCHIIFVMIPGLEKLSESTIGIFLVAMVGSAVLEYLTSYYLEKRFNARWWDYTRLPFNLHGRICLSVSVSFGFAGILVVRVILPFVLNVQESIPFVVFEIVAVLFALVLGADIALTEASLSTLLKEMEDYWSEFDEKAEETYQNISGRIGESVAKYKEGAGERTEALRLAAEKYISMMSGKERSTFKRIRMFNTENMAHRFEGVSAAEFMKTALAKMEQLTKENKKKS